MEYLVFSKKGTGERRSQGTGRKITAFKPTIRLLLARKVSLTDYIWKIISANRYTLFCVYNLEGRCIHRSARVGRCFKFPFLPKGTYEIGPCHTDKEYRGQGIYPEVLSHITEQEQTSYYMLVHRDNHSSIRGVLKAGFTECGYAYKSEKGQWRIKYE